MALTATLAASWKRNVGGGALAAFFLLCAAFFLLCAALPRVTCAQVGAHIWDADTAWYDEQQSRYMPFDIPVHISVRNDGRAAARDVRLTLFSQEALMFEDKLMTRTVDVSSLMSPGDSVDVLLEMKQNIRRNGKLRFLPQLYWVIEWNTESSDSTMQAEGHGVCMHLRDCPSGAIIDDVVTELILPDTLLLDPATDPTGHVVLDVPCRLYSSIGRTLLLKDLTLDVQGESMFREAVAVERMQPPGSLDSLMLRDTLMLNFRVTIPTTIVSTDLMFHIQPYVYLETGCPYHTIGDGGRRIPVHVTHPPERFIALSYEVADVGTRGPELHMRIGSWCGGVPREISSRNLEIIDSGDPVDDVHYNPQEYIVNDSQLRMVFAVDLTASMAMDGGLQRTKSLIMRAAAVAIPGQDSLVLYTLSDHAQPHVLSAGDSAALRDMLDSLLVPGGADVRDALGEAISQEIRFPHDGEVLMYVVTDGWHPNDIASAMDSARGHDIRIERISPVLSYNTKVMSRYYLPMNVHYDMIYWRTKQHRYSWGHLRYPISCAYDVERNFTLSVHDWCGMDTLISGEYRLPDLEKAPRELRLQADDIQIVSGQSFALAFAYTIPKAFTWSMTEFVLEYDTSVLRLDSIASTGLLPGGFFELQAEKGMVHFEYRMDWMNGAGMIAPFYFTTVAAMDTVRTSIRCNPWARYNKCIPGFPAEIAVTALPLSTGVEVPAPASGFEILGLFPQPATDRVQLRYRSGAAGTRSIRVLDLLGRLRWQGEMSRVRIGVHECSIRLPSFLATGTYLLQIWSSSDSGGAVRLASRQFQLR